MIKNLSGPEGETALVPINVRAHLLPPLKKKGNLVSTSKS